METTHTEKPLETKIIEYFLVGDLNQKTSVESLYTTFKPAHEKAEFDETLNMMVEEHHYLSVQAGFVELTERGRNAALIWQKNICLDSSK